MGPPRILVIDDDPCARELSSAHFRAEDYDLIDRESDRSAGEGGRIKYDLVFFGLCCAYKDRLRGVRRIKAGPRATRVRHREQCVPRIVGLSGRQRRARIWTSHRSRVMPFSHDGLVCTGKTYKRREDDLCQKAALEGRIIQSSELDGLPQNAAVASSQ